MIRLSKKEKALMDMLRNFEIDLNYVAYVFTITGGGWGSYHELYIITNDRKVLYSDMQSKPVFLFDLEEELDFEAHGNTVGFDAPDCSMFKVQDSIRGNCKQLRELYCVGMYDNTPAVDRIEHLHRCKNTGKNEHSEDCIYNEDDAMLYCKMILNDHELLVSAREVQVFDYYLDAAKNDDKDLKIDMDAAEKGPFSLVYGGLMFHNHSYEEIEGLVERLKDYAFLDLDREKGDLSASCYQDILLYPELRKADQFIPFAALMQTTHPFDDPDISVTLFPLIGEGRIWEHMANKPFLLACRRKVELDEDVTVENWKDRIDIDELEAAYQVADLYTGPIEA